jgi:hypothetical protein
VLTPTAVLPFAPSHLLLPAVVSPDPFDYPSPAALVPQNASRFPQIPHASQASASASSTTPLLSQLLAELRSWLEAPDQSLVATLAASEAFAALSELNALDVVPPSKHAALRARLAKFSQEDERICQAIELLEAAGRDAEAPSPAGL